MLVPLTGGTGGVGNIPWDAKCRLPASVSHCSSVSGEEWNSGTSRCRNLLFLPSVPCVLSLGRWCLPHAVILVAVAELPSVGLGHAKLVFAEVVGVAVGMGMGMGVGVGWAVELTCNLALLLAPRRRM